MSTNDNCPLISIVIVAFNGWEYSNRCLFSIHNNSYSNYEVIFVNDGSTDGTNMGMEEWAKQEYRIKYLNYPCNGGPALRRNQALECAKGKYIAFLDNDTEQDRNWLVNAVRTMESNPMVGVGQCKLLLLNDKNRFDYAGDYLDQNNGFLIQIADFGELDRGQYDHIGEIFAAKSAGMIARKDVLDIVGGFDKDYFIYMEETDLCWRIRLAGYKVIFIPDSIIYHAFVGSGKMFRKDVVYRSRFHGCKNYIMTHIKNLNLGNLLIIIPIHLLAWLGIAGVVLLRRRYKEFWCIIEAFGWNVLWLKENIRKRKNIQKKRIISDCVLFSLIARKKTWSYFFFKFREGNSYLSKLANERRNIELKNEKKEYI